MNKKKIYTVLAVILSICAIGSSVLAMQSSRRKGAESKTLCESESLMKMKSSDMELELTFLAKAIPSEIRGMFPKLMMDTYIPDSGFADLRVRRNGDVFELTKKLPVRPGDYSVMRELTIPLNEREYEVLAHIGTRKIIKERYCVKLGGYDAEVDVFKGDLLGLILIDFEFESESYKKQFIPPEICLADVTQESFIAGGNLAGKSLNDIRDRLSKFGYQPLFMS